MIRYGATVTDVAETAEHAQAVLDSGATVEGDVLVGADGVRSSVRGRIDPGARSPWRTGRRTIYGFAPRPTFEPPPPEVLRAYVNGAFAALTRDSLTGGCYWFTSLPAPRALDPGEGSDLDLWRTRLIDEFGSESAPAAPAVRDSDRILAFDDYALESLAHWHSDRMVVLGDAAHIAPPGSEQGAAMALEDGVVLAQCLRDDPTPAAALARFEQQRRARAEAVVALGLGGSRRAHARTPARLAHWARDRITALRRYRPLNIGGRDWALNHHIDWDEPQR